MAYPSAARRLRVPAASGAAVPPCGRDASARGAAHASPSRTTALASIVTDSRAARDGRNIERVGYFNPIASGNEKRVELDTARVEHWIGKGAQMTDKVRNLYKEATKAQAAAA